MSRYPVVIEWSDENECYLAICPELPGCMVHGETITEAATAIEGAILDWVEAVKESGLKVPQARSREEIRKHAARSAEVSKSRHKNAWRKW